MHFSDSSYKFNSQFKEQYPKKGEYVTWYKVGVRVGQYSIANLLEKWYSTLEYYMCILQYSGNILEDKHKDQDRHVMKRHLCMLIRSRTVVIYLYIVYLHT